jgi:hypothetical protein
MATTTRQSLSTQPKDRLQRDRHASTTFELHRFPRPIFSFRLKAFKRFRYARGSSRSKGPQSRSAASIAKRKRSNYAHVRPPPPLSNDLAIMQFTGGGNMETHIKRVMEGQAKAASGSRAGTMGVADVYRDANGGVWWDAYEEVEYEHLLEGVDRAKAEDDAEEALWEDFETAAAQQLPSTRSCVWGHDRRPSTDSSASSTASDFDARYLIPPPELDAYPTFTSGELNDRVLASSRVGGETMSALSLPSRPSRQARHLLRPIFLVDLQAFGKPGPSSLASSPAQPEMVSSDSPPGDARAQPAHKPKSSRRRRVSPLNLNFSASAQSDSGPSNIFLTGPASAPISAAHFEIDAIRKQFIGDSFAPPPLTTTSSSSTWKPHTRTVSLSRSSKSSRNGSPKKVIKSPPSSFSLRALFRKRSH